MESPNYDSVMERLKRGSLAPLLFFMFRLYTAAESSLRSTFQYFKIALKSREVHTFTYQMTRENRFHLAHLVSKITDQDINTIFGYFEEIEQNEALRQSISEKIKRSHFRHKKDRRSDFACRVAFYAIIRARKSKVVVENGMELGISSVVLCSALEKNRQEGFEGKYYGFDIDPYAGVLIKDPAYEPFAQLVIGDGMKSLAAIEEPIDFYFSDGFRTYEYEKKELNVLKDKLSEQAVVASNKAIFSTALAELAIETNKEFSFFQEQPANHWYHGWGLGFMY